MTMYWLIPFVLLALALAGSLILFLSLKRDIQRESKRAARRIDQMLARLEQSAETASTAPPPAPELIFVPPPAPHSNFNTTLRVQALRMMRRGEGREHIAAALGIPHAEVELLFRVQNMVAKRTPETPRGITESSAG